MNSNGALLLFAGGILGVGSALVLIPLGIIILAAGHAKGGLACIAIGAVAGLGAAKIMGLI